MTREEKTTIMRQKQIETNFYLGYLRLEKDFEHCGDGLTVLNVGTEALLGNFNCVAVTVGIHQFEQVLMNLLGAWFVHDLDRL
jgi:hypothetical protein